MKIWALFQKAHLVDHFVVFLFFQTTYFISFSLSYINMVTTTSYGMYIIGYLVNRGKYKKKKTFYIQNINTALHMYGN